MTNTNKCSTFVLLINHLKLKKMKIIKGQHGKYIEQTEPFNGYDWKIYTGKNSSGKIRCYAQAGKSKDNMFSYAMLTDPTVNLFEEKARCTDAKLKEIHAKGMARFDELKENGELPANKEAKIQEEYKIEPGQIITFLGQGLNRTRKVIYDIVVGDYGTTYFTVTLDGKQTGRTERLRNIENQFGIGSYYAVGEMMELDQVNNLVIDAKAHEKKEAELKAIETKAANQAEEDFWKDKQKADTKKTTHLLKKLIKQKFGIKCSVRTEKFSMGSSLDLSYDLGPKEELVKEIVDKLQYGYFDGMTDMYENVKKDYVVVDGFVLESQKYTHTKRSFEQDFLLMVATELSYFHYEDKQKPTIENINERILEGHGHVWSWCNLAAQCLKGASFCTSDYTEIENLQVLNFNWNRRDKTIFTYTCKGKRYVTDSLESIDRDEEPRHETALKKIEGITIAKYSEKAGIVYGDTKPIKDQLKKLGCRFNPRLTVNGERVAGWVFQISRMEEISEALGVTA